MTNLDNWGGEDYSDIFDEDLSGDPYDTESDVNLDAGSYEGYGDWGSSFFELGDDREIGFTEDYSGYQWEEDIPDYTLKFGDEDDDSSWLDGILGVFKDEDTWDFLAKFGLGLLGSMGGRNKEAKKKGGGGGGGGRNTSYSVQTNTMDRGTYIGR